MIKDDIMELMRRRVSGVSFAELRLIPGFAGDNAWGDARHNIWFWFGCSAEAVDALSALLAEGAIEIVPSTLLAYLLEGIYPGCEVARRAGHVYKMPRWLPVTLALPAGAAGPSAVSGDSDD